MERTYFEPDDLSQALALLARHSEAKIVAGGTDLVVGARSGKSPLPAGLIAIHRLRELDTIEAREDGGMRIGSQVTHASLEADPFVQRSWTALSDAAALVGSPATRHMGTIGGNICNASPAMEAGSPLLVFDAMVELRSMDRVRSEPFASFVSGPGKTTRTSNELLTAVVVPTIAARGETGSAYLRLEYRQAMEIAVVGAAALLTVDDGGRCVHARVALTAVAPTCLRVPGAEKLLEGSVIDAGLLGRAATAAADAAKPISDVRASAEYRQAMVPVIVQRALMLAWDRATAQGRR